MGTDVYAVDIGSNERDGASYYGKAIMCMFIMVFVLCYLATNIFIGKQLITRRVVVLVW